MPEVAPLRSLLSALRGFFGARPAEQRTPPRSVSPPRGPAPPRPALDFRYFAASATPLDPSEPLPPQLTPLVFEEFRRRLESLPAFPWLASQILEAAQQDNPDVQRLSDLIRQDAMLASQIIRVANSAHFQRGSKVADVRDAVMRLGTGEAGQIATVASTRAMFVTSKTRSFDDYQELWEQLWIHSVACSLGANWLAAHLRLAVGEAAFLGGLMHDLGKMIALQALAELIHAGRCDRPSAEHIRQLLEATHVDVGAEVAQTCRFPASVFLTCRDHHERRLPAIAERQVLHIIRVVSVLDDLLSGTTPEALPIDQAEDSAGALKLDQATLQLVATRIGDFRQHAQALAASGTARRGRELDEFGILLAARHWERDLSSALLASTTASPLAIIFFDMNGLKTINDTQGHTAGDEAIKSCLRVLDRVVGEAGGSAYRIGGDECLAILPGADAGSASGVARRAAIDLAGEARESPLTMSCGIAVATAPGEPAADFRRRADRAQYDAKRVSRARGGASVVAIESGTIDVVG